MAVDFPRRTPDIPQSTCCPEFVPEFLGLLQTIVMLHWATYRIFSDKPTTYIIFKRHFFISRATFGANDIVRSRGGVILDPILPPPPRQSSLFLLSLSLIFFFPELTVNP